MWDLTVVGLTTSRCAISALRQPLGDQRSTSASRGVRSSGSAGSPTAAAPAASGCRASAATTWLLDGRVKRGLAGGDAEDRRADVLAAGVLGQVAAGAGAERSEHALVVGVRRQRDDA